MALPSESVVRAKALRKEQSLWFGGSKEGQCGWTREGEVESVREEANIKKKREGQIM